MARLLALRPVGRADLTWRPFALDVRFRRMIMGREEGFEMTFSQCMSEYRRQLEEGAIQEAYRGLMEYIMGLRIHFESRFPDYSVSGSIYPGYMDMTYFACVPPELKERKLKIAIVFVHDKFRFEVWLAASNKGAQKRYLDLLRESGWSKYHIASTTKGVDSIVDHVLAEDPDFSDLDALTERIEKGTLEFIRDVERFLSKHPG
jgi:hypothetical protein